MHSGRIALLGIADELKYPLLALGVLTVANQAAMKYGLASSTYHMASYVALVALVANRYHRNVTIIIAAASIVICLLPANWRCPSGICYEAVGIASMLVIVFGVRVCCADEELVDLRRFGGTMPFIGIGPDGKICFWLVERRGDWLTDGAVGEAFARILLEAIRSGKERPPMAWIIRDMIRAGQWSGVECGFVQYLSKAHFSAAFKGRGAPLL